MPPKLPIIYRDENLMAVNKPPRVACMGAPGIPHNKTVLHMVEKLLAKEGVLEKPFLLHRLDFATSGVLLIGLNPLLRTELESIVRHDPAREHKTVKKYVALVQGSPRLHGEIDYKLPSRVSGELIDAHTEYKVLKQVPGNFFSLVEATITTGRKHQIRRHFLSIKHPIVMDDQYGDKDFNRKFRLTFRLGRLFLHAREIIFWHPILKKMVRIEAALAPDLKVTLKRIGM